MRTEGSVLAPVLLWKGGTLRLCQTSLTKLHGWSGAAEFVFAQVAMARGSLMPTCGKGPPLLWIGHWVRHLEFDWESPVWRPWLTVLTRRHQVIRYDWRGCGLSDREGVTFSLERHIEDLEAVVEAARLDRFILFASAGGAVVSMAFCVRQPGKISHLLLYGSQLADRWHADYDTSKPLRYTHISEWWNSDGTMPGQPTANSSRRCICRTRAPSGFAPTMICSV